MHGCEYLGFSPRKRKRYFRCHMEDSGAYLDYKIFISLNARLCTLISMLYIIIFSEVEIGCRGVHPKLSQFNQYRFIWNAKRTTTCYDNIDLYDYILILYHNLLSKQDNNIQKINNKKLHDDNKNLHNHKTVHDNNKKLYVYNKKMSHHSL